MKKKTHRVRRLSFILALFLMLSAFVACGDKDNNYSTDDSGNLVSKVESAIDDVSSDVSSVIDDVSSEVSIPDSSDDSSLDDSSLDDVPSTDVSDNSTEPDVSGTDSVPDEPQVEEIDAFRLSSIDDLTDEKGKR
ncbi:MAG: hypothetical protein IKT34_00365, partial [Clostridia bacterium]|nr:hypothetical protein [Clostridia bacterium]